MFAQTAWCYVPRLWYPVPDYLTHRLDRYVWIAEDRVYLSGQS